MTLFLVVGLDLVVDGDVVCPGYDVPCGGCDDCLLRQASFYGHELLPWLGPVRPRSHHPEQTEIELSAEGRAELVGRLVDGTEKMLSHERDTR